MVGRGAHGLDKVGGEVPLDPEKETANMEQDMKLSVLGIVFFFPFSNLSDAHVSAKPFNIIPVRLDSQAESILLLQ